MKKLSSLRIRLVGTVFLAMLPAWALMYFTDLPWTGFLLGLAALGAAWFGGEKFILRQVRSLHSATRRLADGDFKSRTGLAGVSGEMGDLAQTFDQLAVTLEKRAEESEDAQHSLLNRALQQTVVASIGQFALISNDLDSLLTQAVMLVSQNLEVEYCSVLELPPGTNQLTLRAGVGWKDGLLGTAVAEATRDSWAGYTLLSGEPTVVKNLRHETRFRISEMLEEHSVVSGVTVAISTRQGPFGLFGVYTAHEREFTGDEVHFLFAVATAIGMAAERARTEAELQKLAVFAQLNPNPAMELSPDANITYFNDAALKLALSVNKDSPRDILPPDAAAIVQDALLTGKSRQHLESDVDGRRLSWSFHPVAESKVVHCYVEDITERLNLEAQLRQSQKMESVGQLAAGVAHDFNNMLTIIQGHAGLLMAKPDLTQQMQDSAQAVYFAAERAAGLTRQLLMFSRKNVMQTRLLDLRDTVGHMGKMLARLLGETVHLEFNPPTELPLVNADTGMVEQVLMNLAVNARDAMPRGGSLVVSVNPVEIGEGYVQTHPAARTGNFVCLRVTDNGTGMDAATMNRIFEPFFTTKEIGKGTGLGLATVYGIVKQHDGWVEVSSELGKGTTFNVFLPASAETPVNEKQGTDPAAFVRGGTETILVVEDEPVLRDMAHLILEEFGYQIVEAGSGREALDVWKNHNGPIDLLLTDMVMPEGVSGVELAETLLAQKPQLKVIFASGYTMDAVSNSFLRKTNARFLQKPYTRTTLARTVRQALDGRPVPAETTA